MNVSSYICKHNLFYDTMYNYQELLKADEWKKFSSEILKRDNYTCQICHKRGFQNRLLIPITSLTEALDFFSDYRFDGKTIQEIINDKENCKSCEYFFKPTKYNNYYYPLIDRKNDQTNYQYAIEIFNYEDTRLYCDHSPKEKVFFYHKSLHGKLMAHKESNIQTIRELYEQKDKMRDLPSEENSAYDTRLYGAFFIIDHFNRTCNDEGGYMQVIDYENGHQWVKITTNEFCIFMELMSDKLYDNFFSKLNVHHTFYYYGHTLPWGYYWKDLVTLCEDCHYRLHKEKEVPIYDINMRIINDELETCDRCGGSGFLPQYSHVQNGICFKCHGTKKIFMK